MDYYDEQGDLAASTTFTDAQGRHYINGDQVTANVWDEFQAVAAEVGQVTAPNLRVVRDGDRWSVLYGANLQGGMSGWGGTPQAAMADFLAQWDQGVRPDFLRGVADAR